jgi:uncharacterized BrkB/YihY/UPF0761 family membrane protein
MRRNELSDSPEGSAPTKTAERPSLAKRALARLETARLRLETMRPSNPVVDSIFFFRDIDLEAGGFVLAGALAFRFFLAFMPLMLILVGVIGLAAASGESDPSAAAHDYGITGMVATSIDHAAGQSAGASWTVAIIGLFAYLWGCYTLVRALRVTHSHVWRDREAVPRPDSLAGLLVPGTLLTLVLIVAGSGGLGSRHSGVRLVVVIVGAAVYFAGWLLVTWLLPHRDAPLRALLPGAALFGVGIEALQVFTTFYIAGKVERASQLYGAIAGAFGVILWLYLLGRLAIAAATLNATLWERRRGGAGASAGPSPPPSSHGVGARGDESRTRG